MSILLTYLKHKARDALPLAVCHVLGLGTFEPKPKKYATEINWSFRAHDISDLELRVTYRYVCWQYVRKVSCVRTHGKPLAVWHVLGLGTFEPKPKKYATEINWSFRAHDISDLELRVTYGYVCWQYVRKVSCVRMHGKPLAVWHVLSLGSLKPKPKGHHASTRLFLVYSTACQRRCSWGCSTDIASKLDTFVWTVLEASSLWENGLRDYIRTTVARLNFKNACSASGRFQYFFPSSGLWHWTYSNIIAFFYSSNHTILF